MTPKNAGDESGDGPPGPRARLGRKRDHTRDAVILDAALEVLVEQGYEGMTVEMVATRARAGKGTLYRRWTSKSELVLDAIGRVDSERPDHDRLPDTGNLRDDVLALFKPSSVGEVERRLKLMSGLNTMLAHDRALADAVYAAIVEPWARVLRTLLQRAVDRGEIPTPADLDTLAHVIPSMAAARGLLQHKPFDREFLVAMVDGVLLPATRGGDAD